MENYKYVFSESYENDGFKCFDVTFPIEKKLKSLFDLINSWVEYDEKWEHYNKQELIKYVSITLRKKSPDADIYLDIPNENVNNRNVNYQEVNWLLNGITNCLPEVAYWAMSAVPEYMFKNIPGAQRALVLDITTKYDKMVISFKTDKKTSKADETIDNITATVKEIAEAVKNL